VNSSQKILDSTLAFWVRRCGRALTDEDARQIIENMTGSFGLLATWQRSIEASDSGTRNFDISGVRARNDGVPKRGAASKAGNMTELEKTA